MVTIFYPKNGSVVPLSIPTINSTKNNYEYLSYIIWFKNSIIIVIVAELYFVNLTSFIKIKTQFFVYNEKKRSAYNNYYSNWV